MEISYDTIGYDMIFEVFNMYVMSTVRFYESICISVLICIDLRWIQCCSIQSVQSVLPFWKSLFLPFWKCLFQCSSEHSAVLFFVSALFLRLHLLRAKHNGKQLNPFAPRLGRRLGARGSPGQLWILSISQLAISKHVCTAVVHL